MTDSTWPAIRRWRSISSAVSPVEVGPSGLVAGVGVATQRDVEVGRYQQGQPDDPQGGAAFLALAPLGESAALVETVDEGEEIGGVKEDPADVDLEAGDQVVGQVVLDPLDGLGGTRAMWSQKRWLDSCWGRTSRRRRRAVPSNQRAISPCCGERHTGSRRRGAGSAMEGPVPALGTWRSMWSISFSCWARSYKATTAPKSVMTALRGEPVAGCRPGRERGRR